MADDADSRARYESALATEYFVLKGSSGATISESSSRSSLYMVSLSSSLIALGFVLNASEESFLSFAAASRSLGLHRANRRAVFFTMSTVIGALNAVVGGAIVVLVVTTLLAVPTSAAVIAGVVTALGLTGVAVGYQLVRFAPLFLPNQS